MKYFFILFSLLSSVYADKITVETLACPTILQLQKAPAIKEESSLDLSMYAIANSCLILSTKDKVEALGYDSRNSKEIYQRIREQKSARELYMLRSAITVEQGGKKGAVRF